MSKGKVAYRIVNDQELIYLYRSTCIVRAVKSRSVQLAEHVIRIETINVQKF
jgi:hypothetical protein